MQDLIAQERFEIEVLDRLNSGKYLSRLAFGGGTMLRLCHGLDRFSVDLDFWLVKDSRQSRLFTDLREYLSGFYRIEGSAEKFYAILLEKKSPEYPRSLKLEIRKKMEPFTMEHAIAYSRHSNTQVYLQAISLESMMASKIAAFLDRKEIRDVYDMEFLLKRGFAPDAKSEDLKQILKNIDSFTKRDYTVKLSSLLEETQRKYYVTENFKLLKAAIRQRLVPEEKGTDLF